MGQLIVANNPNWDRTGGKSKAGSSLQFSSDEELIANAPPGPVPDRIRQKMVNTAQGPAIVTSYEYDGQGSSTGELVYKCGTHDYETKNQMDFNNHISATHNDTNSKAASVSLPKEPEKPIIEGIPHYTVNKAKAINDFIASNGTNMGTSVHLVNNPEEKTTDRPAGWKEEKHANGSVVYTNPVSKAASVPVNKLQEILRFRQANRNGSEVYTNPNPSSKAASASSGSSVNKLREIVDFLNNKY